MGRLQDKVAIITGAASGLGAEDARLFAREGAKVILTDIDDAGGQKVAQEIGGDAMFLHHDITSEDGWKEVFKTATDRFGGVDVLVNNAAILAYGTIEETSYELWQKIQKINADGYFLGCKYGVLAMKSRPSGSIVNMSSIAGIAGMSGFCAYSASKGSVAAMTRSIAAHCRSKGYKIRCNSIHPDGIKTPMIVKLHESVKPGTMPMPKDINEAMTRLAEPRDIANMVLFLASDESRFVNGAEMRIDNGWLMWAD